VHCAKHCTVCEQDPEKPKCTRLKEKCEWLEVGGPGLVADKGKGKANVMTA